MGFFYVNCPHCNSEMEVEDKYNGEEMTCTICGKDFVPLIGDNSVEPVKATAEDLPSDADNAVKTETAPEAEDSVENTDIIPEIQPVPASVLFEPAEEQLPAGIAESSKFINLFKKISRIAAILILLTTIFCMTREILLWNRLRQMPEIPLRETLRVTQKMERTADSYDILRRNLDNFKTSASSIKITRLLESLSDSPDLSRPVRKSDFSELQKNLSAVSDFEKKVRSTIQEENLWNAPDKPFRALCIRLRNDLQSAELALAEAITETQKLSVKKQDSFFLMVNRCMLILTISLIFAFLIPALGDRMNIRKDQ